VAVTLLRFDQLDSTSLHARRLLDSGELPRQTHLLLAGRQTGGIGRHGRPWSSPQGGLWMTLLWPVETPSLPATLALQTGLAVRRVLGRALGPAHHVQCKWPNDVLCDGKKIAGILIETASNSDGRWLLVGIGCNVNNAVESLAPDVQSTATSVVTLTGEKLEMDIFRKRLVAAVLGTLHQPATDDAAIADFAAHMWGIGRGIEATLPDGSRRHGIIRGLDTAGQLLLEVGGQTVSLASVSGYEQRPQAAGV
jgi:BirA family biotin operon repressor/biotin-[acetyl-CoA-carboxylase] ligase